MSKLFPDLLQDNKLIQLQRETASLRSKHLLNQQNNYLDDNLFNAYKNAYSRMLKYHMDIHFKHKIIPPPFRG